MMYGYATYVSCRFTVSQIVPVFASSLMVVTVSSPPPAYQPTPAGVYHIAIYISPESDYLAP